MTISHIFLTINIRITIRNLHQKSHLPIYYTTTIMTTTYLSVTEVMMLGIRGII
jgi:hypothetical protein